MLESADKKPKASDDNLKLNELVDRRGTKARKGKQAISLLADSFRSSVSQQTRSHEEGMPMMTLKHQWMRNRNLVAGNTVVSLNDEGVAKVTEIGNARLDCEQLCRKYKGILTFVEPEASKVTEPEPEPEAPKTKSVVEKAVETAPEPVSEPVKDVEVSMEPQASEEPEAAAEAPSEDESESRVEPMRKAPPQKKAPPKKRKR